jgi:Cu/Ag efflux pump CusA
VLGDSEAQAATDFRVWTYAIGAAILIFFLLQAGLGSWRMATLYYLLLPVALTGGVLVAVLGRSSVSVVALLGLLTVLAVAIRGGMLQIKHYQRLEQDGQPPGEDLVLLGSRQRFVPAMTGLLATALALIPMVVLGTVTGLEVAAPLAWIILGGLVTAGLLNLFLLPALYLRFAGNQPKEVAGDARS